MIYASNISHLKLKKVKLYKSGAKRPPISGRTVALLSCPQWRRGLGASGTASPECSGCTWHCGHTRPLRGCTAAPLRTTGPPRGQKTLNPRAAAARSSPLAGWLGVPTQASGLEHHRGPPWPEPRGPGSRSSPGGGTNRDISRDLWSGLNLLAGYRSCREHWTRIPAWPSDLSKLLSPTSSGASGGQTGPARSSPGYVCKVLVMSGHLTQSPALCRTESLGPA